MVTGVIGEDVHIMGIRMVDHVLRQAGFKIFYLGAQISKSKLSKVIEDLEADCKRKKSPHEYKK